MDASPRTIARIERAVWVAIYGGLFAIALGAGTGASQPAAAWALCGVGVIAVVAGIVLIVVRSHIDSPESNP